MQPQKTINYKTYFDNYVNSVKRIDIDLQFWKHFLKEAIKNYKIKNPKNRWIYESGFALYNIHPFDSESWLHASDYHSSIEIEDLDTHSDNFFNWVMNLAIVRIYNSVELVFLQAIQAKYFPLLKNPEINRKEANAINTAVRNYLKNNNLNTDTTNNRHLILFLKSQLPLFDSFLQKNMNIDKQTNWKSFYEFFSILRNVVTHNSMMISVDVLNTLNSIAGDVYKSYFQTPFIKNSEELLKAKDEHHFLSFVSTIDSFVANSVKFIAEENDLKFIGLYKVGF